MEPSEFFEEYCTFSTMVMPDGLHPTVRMGHRDALCPFIIKEADGRSMCGVYDYRPLVCRLFPFTFGNAIMLGDYNKMVSPVSTCTMNILRDDLVLIPDKELLNQFIRESILVGKYIREVDVVFDAKAARRYV